VEQQRMNLLKAIISGNVGLWVAWLGGLIALGCLTVCMGRRIRFRRTSQLVSDETGAAYSMSFVLLIPLYLLFCGLMLEITFLIIAKIGTVYGAYAGARSAAVWDGIDAPELAAMRLHQAVCSGIAPFAVSAGFDPAASNSSPAGLSFHMFEAADDYAAAMQKSAQHQHLDSSELVRHYLRVCHRVTVDRQLKSRNGKHEAIITVDYRAPLIFPGVARLFDQDHRRPYDYQLTATIHMIRSVPVSSNQTLGIDYRSY